MKREVLEQHCLLEPSGGRRDPAAVSPPVAEEGSRSWGPHVAACRPLASVQDESDPVTGGGFERGAQDRLRPRGGTLGSQLRGHAQAGARTPAAALLSRVSQEAAWPDGRPSCGGGRGLGRPGLGRWLHLLLE